MANLESELTAPPHGSPENTETMVADQELSRRVRSNALASGLAELVGKISTLAYTLLAARLLSKPEFGAFSYAIAFTALLSSIPSWGFDSLLIQRGSSKTAGQVRTLLSETLLLRFIPACPLFVLGYLAVQSGRPTDDARIALGLVMLAVLFDLWGDALRAGAAALHSVRGVSLALAAQRLMTAVAAIIALQLGFGLVGLSLAYCIGAAVGLAATVVAGRPLGLRPTREGLTKHGLRETFRLSQSLGVGTLVSFVLFRFDAVYLAAVRGDADLAVYMVAYRVFETTLVFSWTIGRAILPAMSANPTPARIRDGIQTGVGSLSFLYLPFATLLIIEGEQVISAVFGARYASESLPALRVLALGPFFFGIWQIASYTLIAQNKSKVILHATLAATVVNIALNLLFTKQYAGVAAGSATTLSYVIGSIWMFSNLRSSTIHLQLMRSILPGLIASIAMAVVLMSLSLPFVAQLMVGGLAATVTWMITTQFAPPASTSLLDRLLLGSLRRRQAERHQSSAVSPE